MTAKRFLAPLAVALQVLALGSCQQTERGVGSLPPDGPGTLEMNSSGVATGTGWRYYKYESGQLQVKEAYIEGKLEYSQWLRPDGTVLAEQRWIKGNGTQYYLRENGAVQRKMSMRNGLANGTATYYGEDGSVEKTVEFKDGKPIP